MLKELMRHYPFYQVDSFTTQPFFGNPAGVVPDARGLSSHSMQMIAREMNLSETAFVFPGESPGADVQVRFFTPTVEVPICGHATIAALHILHHEGAPLGKRQQLTAAGKLTVESEHVDGVLRIWMHQQPAIFSSPVDGPMIDTLLAAIGISADDLSLNAPIQIVSTGHSKVIVPMRERETISGLSPDFGALSHLSAELGCNGYYVWTASNPDPGNLTHGRMFAPAIGIPEDPVTGNASGCLGAYLVHHGFAPVDEYGRVSFYAGQGSEVGRPGRVLVEATQMHPSEPIAIRIAGEAVIALKGTLAVPND